jgi:hypothetical protein
MPAGYNTYGRIRRYDYEEDDQIGGANPTGTVIYENIPMRIESVEPTMALLEQGLETPHFYRTALGYKAPNVKENDEVEVTLPITSWYYGYRFRISSVRHPSMGANDPRAQTVIIMRRMDEAHGKTISH